MKSKRKIELFSSKKILILIGKKLFFEQKKILSTSTDSYFEYWDMGKKRKPSLIKINLMGER